MVAWEGGRVNVGVWEGKCVGEEMAYNKKQLTDTHTLSSHRWSPAETQTTLQPTPPG